MRCVPVHLIHQIRNYCMTCLQESVRVAASGLIRTLRGLTLRLADPQHSPQEQAAAAVSITLPFLVESGGPPCTQDANEWNV